MHPGFVERHNKRYCLACRCFGQEPHRKIGAIANDFARANISRTGSPACNDSRVAGSVICHAKLILQRGRIRRLNTGLAKSLSTCRAKGIDRVDETSRNPSRRSWGIASGSSVHPVMV